jgi:hypothetical protein
MKISRWIVGLLLLLPGISLTAEESFYEDPVGLFSTRPSETKSLQSIDRFGPVGIGIELLQPAFLMRVKNVEKGSPAEATGQLQKGQIIEKINGQRLKDIDPRIQLGQILAQAEATDGRIKLEIKGVPQPVVVEIPVLGAYSETWPLNCPKSDKIVRQVADYLSQPEANKGLAGIGMLFLLSTGEEKDLEVVRQWARTVPAHKYPWFTGYGGIPLAECYLRTGDKEILANIQRWVDSAVKTQHLDAWAGRGSALTTYGNGHLNAAGTHVLTFLLLAKECGANVPDHTLLGALRHFYRYAGRGGNPYGDNRPAGGFVDNGKNGKLAFAMAAAAALTPDGEDSVYAKARDMSAMYGFYSTTFMLHGHTGGGIGEIWRSAAMGLLYDKKPEQYREFMDARAWHYDLSRRFDGSFGILGGSGYDKEQWGVAYPLAYTIPRKTLRITGAPPTQYSHSYQLPKQPWGNDSDNIFLSLDSVADSNGNRLDLSGETLAVDSSLHMLRRLHGGNQPTDQDIRRLIRHPEHNVRTVAAHKALGINYGYIGWKKPGGKVRQELILEFVRHEDPRVRRAMFAAILNRADQITPEVYELAVKAIKDPDESWWVKDAALQIVGRGTADQLVPMVDLLLSYLDHESDWLKNAALTALAPIAADVRTYKQVLPPIGKLIRSNQRISITLGLAPAIRTRLKDAPAEVQSLARESLEEAYTGYAGSKTAQGGLDTSSTHNLHIDAIAESLADVPGGLDVLYEIAKQRNPDQILPHKQYFLSADPSKFGPKLRRAIIPIIEEELIPEYVGRNHKRLEPLATNTFQSSYVGPDLIDGLVALNKRAGHDEYDWQMFVDLREREWSYHSFEPIADEQVPFDQLVSRYREVTLPKGMEDWFAKDFNANALVWRQGKSPFGNYNGKLPKGPITKCSQNCFGPHCYGATPINTLWQNEVLLMRGTFKIPAMEEGFRYRLRINDGNHVGAGGGHIVYINGKPLIESKQGGGRGSGGRIRGAYITQPFLEEMQSGEVTIAVKTFIRYNDKYKAKPTSKTPQGKISIHLEKQKLPPMGDDLLSKSAAVVPMLNSGWQSNLEPEDASQDPDEYLFRWDGKFTANLDVLGDWKLVAEVAEIADYDSTAKRVRVHNAPFTKLTLKEGGTTADSARIWSGDMLMDLTRYQALKMQSRVIAGVDYLFVEAGGFSARHKSGWQTPWLVLVRE